MGKQSCSDFFLLSSSLLNGFELRRALSLLILKILDESFNTGNVRMEWFLNRWELSLVSWNKKKCTEILVGSCSFKLELLIKSLILLSHVPGVKYHFSELTLGWSQRKSHIIFLSLSSDSNGTEIVKVGFKRGDGKVLNKELGTCYSMREARSCEIFWWYWRRLAWEKRRGVRASSCLLSVVITWEWC